MKLRIQGRTLGLGCAAAFALSSACQSFDECPSRAAIAPQLAHLPDRLSETGLFATIGGEDESTAPGVVAYAPAFQLWSDGASKRRWIALPPGSAVDVRDADAWRFPEGTKLWKEFSRDGTRVETRLLLKYGEGDDAWAGAAYVWRADGSDAELTPAGAVNALGTAHDVPAADRCMGCHGGRTSRVLGFSAVQLGSASGDAGPTLDELIASGVVPASVRATKVPGDATERAALGYLHANCSHCHNQNRPETDGPRCYDPQNDLDMSLRASRLESLGETATYETVVGSVVEPGDPEGSRLLELVARRSDGEVGTDQMPPLATERVDADAVALLKKWIARMDP